MDNPEKRKPQETIIVVDAEGNRLHIPNNMGWGHKFWAKIMSEAIIGAALQIEPAIWIEVRNWPKNLINARKIITSPAFSC